MGDLCGKMKRWARLILAGADDNVPQKFTEIDVKKALGLYSSADLRVKRNPGCVSAFVRQLAADVVAARAARRG